MAINTITATLQMRKGLESDLDPDQMTAGEWAVSIDTKYVRMCFAPGVVLKMATYEAFEEDMLEIQTILATCQDIQTAVAAFEQLAEQHASQAEVWSVASKSWAVGGTGTREGEDTNSSKYWSQQSKSEADRAKSEADRASSIAGFDIDSDLSETSTNPVQNRVITGEFYKKMNTDGDASNATVSFQDFEERVNVSSGEKLSVFCGKIKRFFSDLKTVAFTGLYADIADAPQPVNGLESDSETDYLVGKQGKVLDDKISELNRKLADYVVVKEYSKTYNIAASTSAMGVAFAESTPSGYTAVNWNVTDCGTYGVACTYCNKNSANFRNLTSATFNNITAKLRVTYVKV